MLRIGPELEKDIEKKVCDWAKHRGCICYKFTSPSKRSVPDRIFHKDGKTFYVEFKRKGKVPTPSQQLEIDKLRKAGITVAVIDDVVIGKAIIDDILDGEF